MKRRLRRWLQRRLAGADRLRNSVLEIRSGDPLAEAFAEFGPGSVVKFPWRDLGNTSSVAIGSGVLIRSDLALEPLAPRGSVVIRIGDGCHLGYAVRLVAVNGIIIGRACAIGHGATLTDTVHDYKADDEGASWERGLKLGRPLTIEDEVWIGNNTVVAGGLTIGRGAIIGANTYVNRDVPPWTVVAGNPARAVRRRRPDGEWEWLVDPDSLDLGISAGGVDADADSA